MADEFRAPPRATPDGQLTPEAYALLNAIASTESAGNWNVIYGGSRFDNYDQHPREYVEIKSGPNKGKYSSAAGKYQILASTYDRVAPKLGITDFSPESQQKIAWYLANEAYGPGLQEALEAGDLGTVAKRLAPVWTSLPGGIEQGTNLKRFSTAYAKAKDHPVPPMNIPEVGTAIDAIDRASPSPMARSTALAYARPPALPPLSDNLRPLKFDQPIPPRGINALRAADPVVRGVDQFSRDVSSDITPGFDSLMPFATRDGATNARMRAMASPTAADMAPRPAISSVRPIPTIGAQGTPGTPPRLPEPMARTSAPGAGLTMAQRNAMTALPSQGFNPAVAAAAQDRTLARPDLAGITRTAPMAGAAMIPPGWKPAGASAPVPAMLRDIPVPDEGGKYKLIPPLEQYVRAPSPGLRSTALAAARPAPSASSSPMLRSAALASLRAPSLPPKMAPTASPMMRPSTVAFMATPSPGLTSGGGGGGPVTSSDWHRSIFG